MLFDHVKAFEVQIWQIGGVSSHTFLQDKGEKLALWELEIHAVRLSKAWDLGTKLR